MISLFGNKKGNRLDGRVALVTGASRGIGAAVAECFAMEGAHVILLGRTTGALEEIDDRIQKKGGKATLLPFDLSETKKIDAIGPALADRFGRLDILVGNAAMLGNLSPVAMSDTKLHDEVFRVNFLANYHLIRSLDGLLRGSDAGRAVFVTSRLARMAQPFWSAYASSKAALETMVQTYAAEVAYSPLKVNIIDPGAVRTALRHEALPSEKQDDLPTPESVAPRFLELVLPTVTDSGKIFSAAA